MYKISRAKQRGIVYQFKWGETMEELARMYELELLEVEQIIREYMIANSPSVVR